METMLIMCKISWFPIKEASKLLHKPSRSSESNLATFILQMHKRNGLSRSNSTPTRFHSHYMAHTWRECYNRDNSTILSNNFHAAISPKTTKIPSNIYDKSNKNKNNIIISYLFAVEYIQPFTNDNK